MADWNHYIVTEDKEIEFEELESVLQKVNSNFFINGDVIVQKHLILKNQQWDELPCGQIEFISGDQLEDYLEDIRDYAEEKEKKEVLLETIRHAKYIVQVQLVNVHIWSGLPYEQTLNSMFEWLIANREGVLMVEGGDFYNRSGQIV